jgi:hypothetical protein
MKELIDLTDKLAKKHGSLVHKVVPGNINDSCDGAHFDWFFVFSLTFSFFVMVLEPLFICIWP